MSAAHIVLVRRLAAWIAPVPLVALVACAEPGVTEHVQADHASGLAGTSSLHADRTLAQQGVTAAGSQVDADRRADGKLSRRRASR